MANGSASGIKAKPLGDAASIDVSKPMLVQVSLITPDPAKAAAFYMKLFDAEPEYTVNPETYRGVAINGCFIGFNAPTVRGVLNLDGPTDAVSVPPNGGDAGYFTIRMPDADSVREYAERAQGLGATLIYGPQQTPFGWMVAALRDPVGHVFRLASVEEA